MNRSKDDRGQVLSSLVAVLAVVAIVAGLLVLFGTRGDDSVADTKSSTTPSAKASSTTPAPASAPVTTAEPTTAPSSAPTTVPTSAPTAEPTTAPTTAPTTVPPVKTLAPVEHRPAVEVYNNTNRKGLADSVAGRARQAGWTVTGADNWHGKIVASTVYYPAGMLSEANQLAKDIGVGRVKDALPNMKKDRLSVILTTDYTG